MPTSAPRGSVWSDAENDVVVAAYLELLTTEIRREPAVKAEVNRRVQGMIGRSRGSVEYKLQNVSAVLLEMGLPIVGGYKPASNFQESLTSAVERALADGTRWSLAGEAERASAAKVAMPAVDFQWSVLPSVPIAARSEFYTRHRRAVKVDFAAIEAANRALGEAGELAVVARERRLLRAAGRSDLADEVRHVSAEDGDGLGFDILSFTPIGDERFLEVKATRWGRFSPMKITRNEVAFSAENSSAFELHRVFSYTGARAGLFVLPGSIEETCDLVPTLFSGTPSARVA